MLRSLAIAISSNISCFYTKSGFSDVVISPPTSLQKFNEGGCNSYLGNPTGQSRLRNFKIVPRVAPSSIVFQRLSSTFLFILCSLLYLFDRLYLLNCSYVALVSLPCYYSSLNRSSKQSGTSPSWLRGPSSPQASPVPYDPPISPFSWTASDPYHNSFYLAAVMF
jgi:hypothetical protein